MIIYLDESGNTGDNLLDKKQEFFAISAIAINKNIQDSVFTNIAAIMAATKMKEIKTKDIIGTKHEPLLIPAHQVLINYGSKIFTVLLEKRYMIAIQIVENFFDPVYNTRTNNRWSHPLQIKIDYANIFYEKLSESCINAAAEAFKSGNEIMLKCAYLGIDEEIESLGKHHDLLWFFKGAESMLSSLSKVLDQSENKLEDKKKHRVIRSPNYTTFYSLLNTIEIHLRKHNVTAPLYFDSAAQFDEPFTDLFLRISQAPKTDFELGDKLLVFGYEAISEFIPANEKLFGLQLSDLVATSTYKVFKKLKHRNRDTKFTDYEKYVVQSILSQIKDGTFSGVISNRMWHEYYSCLTTSHKNYIF